MRAARGDDLTSDLLAIHDEDPERLTVAEIASILFSLSFAGHETTTGLIGNTVRRLLEAPERWDVVVRATTPDDYPAFSLLFRELGVDDPTPSAERFAADLVPRTLIYERDEALAGFLIAAGAEVRLRLLHYAGPLPQV